MFDTLKPYQVAWQHLADLNDQFVYLFFCTYYTFWSHPTFLILEPTEWWDGQYCTVSMY